MESDLRSQRSGRNRLGSRAERLFARLPSACRALCAIASGSSAQGLSRASAREPMCRQWAAGSRSMEPGPLHLWHGRQPSDAATQMLHTCTGRMGADGTTPAARNVTLTWHNGRSVAKTETKASQARKARPLWSRVVPGHRRWRWDLNPRKGCPFTRFRVLRNAVHHRPPAFVTRADGMPAVAGERPRTGVNETQTETRTRAATDHDAPIRGGGS